MEWKEVLSFLGVIVTVGASAWTGYLSYQLNQKSALINKEVEQGKTSLQGDVELRSDMLDTIKQYGSTLEDFNKQYLGLLTVVEDQQKNIDLERVKRRMTEMENDHLARDISRLKEENKVLQEKIAQLNTELDVLKLKVQMQP
jgi:chromosome segregation ATPase